MTNNARLSDPDTDEEEDPILDDEEEDPILEARLEHAIAPYRGLFPPEDLERMRDFAAEFLTTHPVAVKLMDRLRQRRVPASSGERLVRDPAVLAEAAKRPGNPKKRIAG